MSGRDGKKSEDRAPLCPICKTRHWNREPHKFTKQKKGKK